MSKDETMSTEDGVNKSLSMSRRAATIGAVGVGLGALGLGHSVTTNRNDSGQAPVTEPEVTIRRPENGQEFEEGTDVGYIVDVLTAQESGELTITSGGYERNEDLGAQTDREFQGEISDLEPGDQSLEALLEYDGKSVGETVNFEVNPTSGGASDDKGQESEPDYPFGSIESSYLSEDDIARDNFEDYLDDVDDRGLLDTLEVVDSSAHGYMLQTDDSDVDLQTVKLSGNPQGRKDQLGLSGEFSGELYEFSDNKPEQFTDFLEYVQSDEIYE